MVLFYWHCTKTLAFLLKQQWNISTNFQNFISFLKWMCPTKTHLKSVVDSTIHKWVLVHNLTQQTGKFSQNLLCLWTLWVLLSRPQLVRNHVLVSLPQKQQDGMVQPFGHFWSSLKRQSPDYFQRILYKSQPGLLTTINFYKISN